MVSAKHKHHHRKEHTHKLHRPFLPVKIPNAAVVSLDTKELSRAAQISHENHPLISSFPKLSPRFLPLENLNVTKRITNELESVTQALNTFIKCIMKGALSDVFVRQYYP